ncbi:MAG TPA: hypothetical protein VKF17_20040, partial [Isosphaeraceae bacterium]|nr:hypothetical protein [Isosphaeraceae bacterium]
ACWRPIPDTPFDPFAGPILLLAARAVNRISTLERKRAGRSGLALILCRVLQSSRQRLGNPRQMMAA